MPRLTSLIPDWLLPALQADFNAAYDYPVLVLPQRVADLCLSVSDT